MTTDMEWPDEIWAEEAADSYLGIYRRSPEQAGSEPLEHARYVHHGLHDSLKKYHETMVANLRAEIDALKAMVQQ